MQVGVQGLGVLDVVLGCERHAGREQHAPLDTLLLQNLETGRAFEVLGAHRFGLVRLLRIARRHLPEHLLERSGPVGQVEAAALLAVEDGDPVARHDHLAARRGDHGRDGLISELLGQIPCEGVSRFVAVRIAVEDRLRAGGVTHG